MSLSCSDTCELLMEKMLAAGFKIDPAYEGQEDLYEALKTRTILPPDGQVQVVVTLQGGLVDDVWAFTTGEKADLKQAEQDKVFNLERDADGFIQTEGDDFVGTYLITVDQFDDTEAPRSPWTGNRLA